MDLNTNLNQLSAVMNVRMLPLSANKMMLLPGREGGEGKGIAVRHGYKCLWKLRGDKERGNGSVSCSKMEKNGNGKLQSDKHREMELLGGSLPDVDGVLLSKGGQPHFTQPGLVRFIEHTSSSSSKKDFVAVFITYQLTQFC